MEIVLVLSVKKQSSQKKNDLVAFVGIGISDLQIYSFLFEIWLEIFYFNDQNQSTVPESKILGFCFLGTNNFKALSQQSEVIFAKQSSL